MEPQTNQLGICGSQIWVGLMGISAPVNGMENALKIISRVCLKEYYNFYFVARLWNIYKNIFLAALKLALGALGWFFDFVK